MSEGTTCHKRVKCTQGGRTAHIVPVPRLMGLKDFPLNYCSFLERYKLWRFDRIIWQRQNYRQQALCLRINPHFRARQNCERHKIYGAWEKRLHINEQTSRTAVVVVTFDNFFPQFLEVCQYFSPVVLMRIFSWWWRWWWWWWRWWWWWCLRKSGHSVELWGR